MKLSVSIHNITALVLVAASALTGCASEMDEPVQVDTACLEGCSDVADSGDAADRPATTADSPMTSGDYLAALGQVEKTLAYDLELLWPLAEAVVVAQDGEMTDEEREFLEGLLEDGGIDEQTKAIAMLATRADDAEPLHPLEAKIASKLTAIVKLHWEELPTLVPGQTQ